ncbi:PEP-CTERM sorting domain-containing protein [Verrucomicrobiaceae bacterium N1E253]|uniref:PEP-CTERM sorting domain-containing protein n=1 Tax=Oceaniferula marina TaxID=2748318 RepID=A0A851GMK8_9BACT|nr:PEP-CTERM sorting domain-containing protein [Oceaniferula marina]NWK55354.1 PEP-CTERM sorting domain-containing protein [Oceaniferula marina]
MKYAVAASVMLTSMATSYGIALSVDLDGIYSGESGYTNTETVTWYNGHKADESIYGDFDSQSHTTTIRYGIAELEGGKPGEEFFFLYVEAPLYAKNMIWQSNVNKDNYPVANTDPTVGLTATDVDSYRTHHETHHKPGDLKLDFGGATGSEKLVIVDSSGDGVFEADLAGDADDLFNIVGYKDSSNYLLENGISTEALSLARTTPMAFEFQFAVDAVDNAQIVQYMTDNGIELHLSPERGLLPDDPGPNPLPEPGTAMLSALGILLMFRRRKA